MTLRPSVLTTETLALARSPIEDRSEASVLMQQVGFFAKMTALFVDRSGPHWDCKERATQWHPIFSPYVDPGAIYLAKCIAPFILKTLPTVGVVGITMIGKTLNIMHL